MFRKTRAKTADGIVRAWVKALRSGDYRQGKGVLRNNDFITPQYCCLGVLNKITGETVSPAMGYLEYHSNTRNPLTRIFPEEIIPWLFKQREHAMGDKYGTEYSLLPNSLQVELASMNDKHSSFCEIADVIESSWENFKNA